MLSVIMLIVFMLSVFMLNVFMVSVVMLSIDRLNAIMLNVLAPKGGGVHILKRIPQHAPISLMIKAPIQKQS